VVPRPPSGTLLSGFLLKRARRPFFLLFFRTFSILFPQWTSGLTGRVVSSLRNILFLEGFSYPLQTLNPAEVPASLSPPKVPLEAQCRSSGPSPQQCSSRRCWFFSLSGLGSFSMSLCPPDPSGVFPSTVLALCTRGGSLPPTPFPTCRPPPIFGFSQGGVDPQGTVVSWIFSSWIGIALCHSLSLQLAGGFAVPIVPAGFLGTTYFYSPDAPGLVIPSLLLVPPSFFPCVRRVTQFINRPGRDPFFKHTFPPPTWRRITPHPGDHFSFGLVRASVHPLACGPCILFLAAFLCCSRCCSPNSLFFAANPLVCFFVCPFHPPVPLYFRQTFVF